jgi:hypothetical protein
MRGRFDGYLEKFSLSFQEAFDFFSRRVLDLRPREHR